MGGRRYERLPALAADLVALKVAVIVGTNPFAAQAAKKATDAIPIAFLTGDPVGEGLSPASAGRAECQGWRAKAVALAGMANVI